MNLLLTNGIQLLTPSIQPSLERSAEVFDHSSGRDAVFGPTHARLNSLASSLWWGEFLRGDRLRVKVRGGSARGLVVELLDAHYEPIASATVGAEGAELEARALRTGVCYLRIVNNACNVSACLFELHVERVAPLAHPAPRRASRLGAAITRIANRIMPSRRAWRASSFIGSR